MMRSLVRAGLFALVALVLTPHVTAQVVVEIPAPTVATTYVDMDLVGPPGPTTIGQINAAGVPVPAALSNITLTPSGAAAGVYNTNPSCVRALVLGATGTPLELIDAPAGAFTAFDAQIDLGGPSTEIGIGIGDWVGPMILDFYLGGVLQTTYTSTTYTTCNNKFFQMTGGQFDRVDLQASTAAGNWVITELEIQLVRGLFPNFTAAPRSGPSPLPVAFTDATFTSDPAGVQTWAWDFDGDGAIDSTAQNPRHVYPTCGRYSVSLTVTDTQNPPATITKTDYIEVDPQRLVVADFTGAPLAGVAPHGVRFLDTSTGGPLRWAWDFEDDGTIDSTAQNPTHVYPVAGRYTVVLTVSNPCSTDTERKVNYVTVIGMGTNHPADLLNYQFNEVRGPRHCNAAVTGAYPPFGTTIGFAVTDPGRPNFRANERGFGCLAYGGAGVDNDVDTGGPVSVQGSITVMFWMRRNPASTTTNPFGYAFGDGTFRCFAAGVAGSGLLFRGSSIGDVASGFPVVNTPGVWQHVALVVDDVAGRAEWYDGGLPSGAPVMFTPGAFSYSGVNNLWVASNNGSSEWGDHYDLDDFRFYGRALSPGDVFAGQTSEVASNCRYDQSCDGLGASGTGPFISAPTRPTVGNLAYRVDLTGATPMRQAALALGIQADAGGLLPVPVGPGCVLSTLPILIVPTGTDPAGNASLLLPIPPDPSLAGGHIYSQYVVLAGPQIEWSDALDTNVEMN